MSSDSKIYEKTVKELRRRCISELTLHDEYRFFGFNCQSYSKQLIHFVIENQDIFTAKSIFAFNFQYKEDYLFYLIPFVAIGFLWVVIIMRKRVVLRLDSVVQTCADLQSKIPCKFEKYYESDQTIVVNCATPVYTQCYDLLVIYVISLVYLTIFIMRSVWFSCKSRTIKLKRKWFRTNVVRTFQRWFWCIVLVQIVTAFIYWMIFRVCWNIEGTVEQILSYFSGVTPLVSWWYNNLSNLTSYHPAISQPVTNQTKEKWELTAQVSRLIDTMVVDYRQVLSHLQTNLLNPPCNTYYYNPGEPQCLQISLLNDTSTPFTPLNWWKERQSLNLPVWHKFLQGEETATNMGTGIKYHLNGMAGQCEGKPVAPNWQWLDIARKNVTLLVHTVPVFIDGYWEDLIWVHLIPDP